MTKFIIREFVNGVLIPLRQVVHKLADVDYMFVVFRDVHFNSGRLLDIPVPEFERLSRDLVGGFVLARTDFDRVLHSEVQVLDGVIEFIGSNGVIVLRLECMDASQWELTTDHNDVSTQLERRDLKRDNGN